MTGGKSVELVGILRGLTPERASPPERRSSTRVFASIEVPLNSPQPFDSIRLLAEAHRTASSARARSSRPRM